MYLGYTRQSEARAFCHRIYAMLAGIIEKIDLRERQPLHPYAKIFDPYRAHCQVVS